MTDHRNLKLFLTSFMFTSLASLAASAAHAHDGGPHPIPQPPSGRQVDALNSVQYAWYLAHENIAACGKYSIDGKFLGEVTFRNFCRKASPTKISWYNWVVTGCGELTEDGLLVESRDAEECRRIQPTHFELRLDATTQRFYVCSEYTPQGYKLREGVQSNPQCDRDLVNIKTRKEEDVLRNSLLKDAEEEIRRRYPGKEDEELRRYLLKKAVEALQGGSR
jgi:hypothetical protein